MAASAVRTCDVPAGKAILVPINVVECSFAETNVKTEEELHTCAEEDESSNPGLFLSVDGKQFKDLETYRVHSRAFDTNFPENPIFGKPGPTKAVSDGYWVILEPLSPGKHDIHFKASLTNPTTGILFYNDDCKIYCQCKVMVSVSCSHPNTKEERIIITASRVLNISSFPSISLNNIAMVQIHHYNIEIAMLAMIIGIGIVAIDSLLLILNHLLFNSQLVIVAFGLGKGSSLLLSSTL